MNDSLGKVESMVLIFLRCCIVKLVGRIPSMKYHPSVETLRNRLRTDRSLKSSSAHEMPVQTKSIAPLAVCSVYQSKSIAACLVFQLSVVNLENEICHHGTCEILLVHLV